MKEFSTVRNAVSLIQKWKHYQSTQESNFQRLSLAYMAHTINKIFAGAYREHVDVLEHFQPPQYIRETELITRSETNHLVEPEAHKHISQRGMLPHDNRRFGKSCTDQQCRD